MKKLVGIFCITLLLVLLAPRLFAQVSISTDGGQPDPSAMLDVKSAVKGFLPPRVALTSLDATGPIVSPVALGLLVFNTASINNVVPGYYYWNGGRWVAVATPLGATKGDMLYWDGNAWATIPSGAHGKQLYFCEGRPTWGGCFALVETAAASGIKQTSAECGGNVTSEGGCAVIERGVCYSTSPEPTITCNKTSEPAGPGVFTHTITGLNPSTTYYARAYAINGNGEAYGKDTIFTTTNYAGAPVTSLPSLSICPGTLVDIPVTVGNFTNIGSIALNLHFNSSVLTYTGATNTSGYSGLQFNDSETGVLSITGAASPGVTYPDNTVLFTLHFNYEGGSTELMWFDNGTSCEYRDGELTYLNDVPANTYYINGAVNESIEVETPVFDLGSISSICQGAGSVTYTATAANSTSITYLLDPLSVAAGNSIDPNTGAVTYATNWSGTSVITATALGCGGPKTGDHTVTIAELLPVSVSITESADTVCGGYSVTFTAVAVNGGTNPVYQWKVNGTDSGSNSDTFTYVPENGDDVTCVLTSDINCASGNPATSNVIQITVNPSLPVSVTITGSDNNVCEGTSVTFTAVAVNGGTAPAFQWQVNGVNAGTNSPDFSYIPANNDLVTCILTSDMPCATGNPATSDTITMIVNTYLAVSVSVVASDNNVCEGTIVTFTATPVNGGTSPVYQWKVNGTDVGTNSETYAYAPVNNDVVTCVLTSNTVCTTLNTATSNEVQMIINPVVPVSITITASAINVCEGTLVTLTANAINGGLTPVYQWKVNGLDAGTNSPEFSYAPANNDIVNCLFTSNETCPDVDTAESNPITFIVNPVVPVSVSITASENPACAGATVSFTAIAVNGGTDPLYQWTINGTNAGTNSAVFAYEPANDDVVICNMTSNAICPSEDTVPSNAITMSVNPNANLPVGVSIAADPAGPVGAGVPVLFTATPVNGGTSPIYQWLVNGITAGTNDDEFTYVPVTGDVVSCVLTSNEQCVTGNPATSNSITMVVNAMLPVSVSITASANPVCVDIPVIFTATPENGGTAPAYQWKVNGLDVGSNNPEFTFIPVNGDAVTCVLTSSELFVTGNPATSNTIPMTVNPNLTASVSIATSINPSCDGTPVAFTATPVNGGTSPTYQWKVNGTNTGTTNPYTYIPQHGDVITCEMTSNASCISGNPATSNTITMTVNTTLAVSVSIVPSVYAVMPGTQVTFTATGINGGSTPTYQWKVNGVNTGTNSTTHTYTPGNNDKITCVFTSSITGCTTANPATSNQVVMIVYVTGSPCTGVPTVTHGGLTYNTVQVGTQCWLRENMNVGTMISGTQEQTNNSTLEKYCYNNNEANCNVYGGMYQWAEMVQYLNNATNTTNWSPVPTGPVQGICPAGWHIPSNAEWGTMMTYLGGIAVTGGKIKQVGTNHFNNPNTGATNTSGYTAIPGGQRWSDGTFHYLNMSTAYWTITSGGAGTDIYYGGASYSINAATNGQFYKVTGVSVRCLKNN